MKRVITAALVLLFVIGCSLMTKGYKGGRGAATKSSMAMSRDGLRAEQFCVIMPEPKLNAPGIASESYDSVADNPFRKTSLPGNDASTFSIDVDTASYSNVRRILMQERTSPPPGAVRIEELVNYFAYNDAPPSKDSVHPFAVHTEMAPCPWNESHKLLRIGLKGKTMQAEKAPDNNLVFLIDVSGSMAGDLDLVKEGLRVLVRKLGEKDRVAIVVYAGSTGLVLPSTTCDRKTKIIRTLNQLQSGGSTNGGAGIQLAYKVAGNYFIEGGNNRVILCTDGDFNVGISDRSRLTELIEKKAKSGIDLTILGFGMGNYKDSTMEELSNNGNGNYYYIDGQREARKVLVDGLTGTLFTIAKDVKIQIFFNPARVESWRLIGYENRRLAREDFNDDKKDAGDIGAGHSVVALYELVPPGADSGTDSPAVDNNPYVKTNAVSTEALNSDDLLRLRLRYKRPGEEKSILQELDIKDNSVKIVDTTDDFRWSTAVAGFGMLLRESKYAGALSWKQVTQLAQSSKGKDPHGLRGEFLELVSYARGLK